MALLLLSSSRALGSPSPNAWPLVQPGHVYSALLQPAQALTGLQLDLASIGLCVWLTNAQKPNNSVLGKKFKELLNLIQLSEFPRKDRTG